MNILHVIADPLPPAVAVNKRIAEAFFATLVEIAPDTNVDTHDLYADRPPFIDAALLQFLWMPATDGGAGPGPAEEAARQYVRTQCARVAAADVLVLAAPVWNYGVPAILKAWIDVIIAPNHTFRFGAHGPEPLHKIKDVFFFLSSGGTMTRHNARHGLTDQIGAAFGFIGIREPKVVWADGQDSKLHPDYRQREQAALDQARSLAREIAAHNR